MAENSATEERTVIEWERYIAGPMFFYGVGRVHWVLDWSNCLCLVDHDSRLVYRRVETYVAENSATEGARG